MAEHNSTALMSVDYSQRLYQLARSLNQSLDLPTVMSVACELSRGWFGCASGCLILVNQQHRMVRWISEGNPRDLSVLVATLGHDRMTQLLDYGLMQLIAEHSPLSPYGLALVGRLPALVLGLRANNRPIALLALGVDRSQLIGDWESAVREAGQMIADALSRAALYSSLAEVDQARDQMINLLVHDIRSPLMATHASIEIVRRAVGDMPIHPFVSEALVSGMRSVRSVIDLTNDLLDVKRLQSNYNELNYRSVNMNSMITDICEQMQNLAHERRVQIRWSIEPDSLTAEADPRLLRRAITNLVANAIRFTAEATLVDVTASVLPNGDRLLTVYDRGPGVPIQDRLRIFQAFVQAQGESHRGTGLGLALCREVALAHKGEVWVEDREGGGSSFRLRLPYRIPTQED